MDLVYPKESNFKKPIDVKWFLDGKNFHVDFKVNVPVFHEKKKFSEKDYPYQFDVVEVFVVVDEYEDDKNLTYYEFELTPNNQTYHLRLDMVEGKRIPDDRLSLQAETLATRLETHWTGGFIIPLNKLGWGGDLKLLKGNFYGIIGKSKEKTYWSRFLGQQEEPNFHTPSSFKPLFPEEI